jgi:hypothetical protein
MIPFAYPYSLHHHTKPAIHSAVIVKDASLRVLLAEGTEFCALSVVAVAPWGTFKEIMDATGHQRQFNDKDSAQVAVTWAPGGSDTNAKEYTTDPQSAGAIWEWLDPAHMSTPNQAVKHDFTIPSGARRVTVVLIYTDTVYEHFPTDAPVVFGAWAGAKGEDGKWTFKGVPAPVNPSYPPTYREPSGTECEGLFTAVRTFLVDRTGFTLKPRRPGVLGIPSSANAHNTGFDLVKP